MSRPDLGLLVADGTKEIVSSSLDKSMVLWRMQVGLHLVRFGRMAHELHLKIEWRPQRSEEEPEVFGRAEEVVRMTSAGAPVFSLAAEVPQPGEQRHQIFCGNAARSVVVWDLPSAQLQDKASHFSYCAALLSDSCFRR